MRRDLYKTWQTVRKRSRGALTHKQTHEQQSSFRFESIPEPEPKRTLVKPCYQTEIKREKKNRSRTGP